ncbi:MAG: thiamine phosphate synthase [Chloroflexi bacterium]|nr:thiamine phosphate synthase [Chloroflexota bacterium]
MTSSPAPAHSILMSSLLACLDGLLASDAVPEGLMRGEIGWLGDGISDPQRQSTGGRGAQSRHEALGLARAADGLLTALEDIGEIPADAALQLRRALDDAVDRIGAVVRQAQASRIRGLYVIIDPEVTGGRDPFDIARAAINGGARMLQLRDKLRDKGEQLPLGTALRDLCAANDALLIINDHADLAAALGPEHVGLHVGQTDLPVAEARKVLAPGQVLGRSNREIELIVESQQMGADHVAFGAMYTTTTKEVTRAPQGPERLKQARAAARVPLVAIGGITAENVAPVVEAGADAICVTAAVGSAPNPEAAAAELTEAIRSAGGRV